MSSKISQDDVILFDDVLTKKHYPELSKNILFQLYFNNFLTKTMIRKFFFDSNKNRNKPKRFFETSLKYGFIIKTAEIKGDDLISLTETGMKFLSVAFKIPINYFDFGKIETSIRQKNYTHDLTVNQIRFHLLNIVSQFKDKVKVISYIDQYDVFNNKTILKLRGVYNRKPYEYHPDGALIIEFLDNPDKRFVYFIEYNQSLAINKILHNKVLPLSYIKKDDLYKRIDNRLTDFQLLFISETKEDIEKLYDPLSSFKSREKVLLTTLKNFIEKSAITDSILNNYKKEPKNLFDF